MNKQGEENLLNIEMILHKAGIGENMVIADLGCGSVGHFVFPAARFVGKGGKVYAVDILKTTLGNIKRKIIVDNISNVVPIWSDLEVFKGTKIETGSLDVALLINTLYQSKHRGAILRETTRLLKKGGSMIVVEWKKSSLPFGPKAEDRVEEKHVIQAGQKLGLNYEEDFFVGRHHYGLIFTKL